jgi:hypothetical protein
MVFMESKGFKAFDEPHAQMHECTSIHETTNKQYCTEHRDAYIDLIRRRIHRVYPSGARIDSSNFHPQAAFDVGAQMCAMNFQDTTGYEMRLYRSKFYDNGGTSGYVLKPDFLRTDGKHIPYPKPNGERSMTIDLEILGGFNLPKPQGSGDQSEVIDPYCWVMIEGPYFEPKTKVGRTKTIDDNGFRPIWAGDPASKMSVTVHVPELSSLVIQVFDKDVTSDDFIAEAISPCHLLRPGYRCVRLWSEDGRALPNSFLMVKITITKKEKASASQSPATSSVCISNTSLVQKPPAFVLPATNQQPVAAAAAAGAPPPASRPPSGPPAQPAQPMIQGKAEGFGELFGSDDI